MIDQDVDEILNWDDVHRAVQRLVNDLLWPDDADRKQRQELYEVVRAAVEEWGSWQQAKR